MAALKRRDLLIMEVRLAFSGFSPVCVGIVQVLLPIKKVNVVGILADDVPADWPSNLEPPELFSSSKELFDGAKPNLLMVCEGSPELNNLPSKCQVIHVQKNQPLASLLGALPLKGALPETPQEEIQEIIRLCTSVNIVEAYSDPRPKLGQLLDRAMAISGAEFGMVLLPSEVMDELEVVLVRGENVEHLAGKNFDVKGSICGNAFDECETMESVLGKEFEEGRALAGTGIIKLLAIPLRAEARVGGVLALGKSGEDFEPVKMSLLSLVADQASLAIQVARLYSEMETNVVRDSASGLFNQHYFHSRIKEEVNRARRYSLNVCLVVIEIDGFEEYLKRNGRFMGDFILSDVGSIILRNTREVDTPARYGDKVFAVLLPETRRLGSMRFAERIRKVMEEYPFPSRERKEVERLTVCAGISSFPANADNEQDLMEKAFTALAAAKAVGPSNIRLYSPTLVEETIV
jgi:diguanylate cyclase (GGDEF)-like protein